MDKYTVDLDKVLNDFEYSELTEQYKSKSIDSSYSSDSTNINRTPQRSDTSSSFKNSHIKHSINNVFHSLNEYLKTDIGSVCLNQNNEKENVQYIDFPKEKDCTAETKNNSDVYKSLSFNSNRNKVDLKEFISNDLNIQNTVTKTEEDNINSDNSKSVKQTTSEDGQKINEPKSLNNKYINEDSCLLDTENNYFSNKLSDKDSVIRDKEVEINNHKVKLSLNEDPENVNELKSDIKLEETASKKEGKIDKNNVDITENIKEINDSKVEEKNDDNTVTKKVIGFEEVTVDESELEEYLQKLEVEYDAQNKTDKEIVQETFSKDDSNQETNEIITSEEKSEEASTFKDENTPEQDLHKKEIMIETNQDESMVQVEENSSDNICETSNQILNRPEDLNSMAHETSRECIVQQDVEAEIPVDNLKEQKMEIAEECMEDKLEKSNDKLVENQQDVLQANDEVVEDKCVATEVQNENNTCNPESTTERCETPTKEKTLPQEIGAGDQSKKESTNSPRRPSVLEVKSVIKQQEQEEESANNVNVIGNPGSTPYNSYNPYKSFLSKEDTPTESDTDSLSSSSSPTFSDMSTVSSATTATVDSCNNSIDHNMNINEKMDDQNEYKLEKSNEKGEDKPINLESQEMEEQVSNYKEQSGNCKFENEEPEATNLKIQNDDIKDCNLNEDSVSKCPASNSTLKVVENSGSQTNNMESSLNQSAVQENETTQPNSDTLTVDVAQNSYQSFGPDSWLGKQAPLWIPDSEALNCLHCDMKFTIIKRRHHCRACGLVLCSKCCNLQYRLEYLDAEARVCKKCYDILSSKDNSSSSGSEVSPVSGNSPNYQGTQPNPNNPMEYCSVVPPLQQVSGGNQNPPPVMVPVGVLKRKGSGKTRKNKSVMFCDGIRPGSELTNLDNDFNYSESKTTSHKILTSPTPPKSNRNVPETDSVTKSFIPSSENDLPPRVTIFKSDISYKEQINDENLVKQLREETITFAVQRNLYVSVQLIDMHCCINKWAWCFSTDGLTSVGQDEIIILLEYIENEKLVPKDVFIHLNNIYVDVKKGSSISELGISLHQSVFLGSKNHAGFLYIRPTHQCLKNVIVPKEPYLIGILIHRWEIPWAKIFPLRLVLRLGAEYRYYPSPIISTRHRESVFVEIGHTIINLLADFRNFSYTLPNIRGLVIHMEGKMTTVMIPSNRYDQVMKSINNSSEHILAFGGNFSVKADSHLVCIQDTQGKNENTYTTHTISIQNRPREVTGVSFIVFNGDLKSTSGLTAKSSVVEDGLMIHIPSEQMVQLRDNLRNMKDYTIHCGCINATSDELVKIVWGENDVNFNLGVLSPIDNESLSGVPSIRVHNGKDYVCNSGSRMIRWTEVFILQNGDENCKGQEIDYSKISESISKATCQALVKYLDLLSSNNFYKIGIRTNLHTENVSYSAGSNGIKLPPIYMKSLDNELIPVLHRITSNNWGESTVVLELIFRVLNV